MITKDFRYRNKIWLEKNCEIYSIYEIAEQCGVTHSTIRNWVEKFGITKSGYQAENQPLKIRLSLDIPSYMMLHLKRHAMKIEESVNQVVMQAITEFFLRSGINIFRRGEDERK